MNQLYVFGTIAAFLGKVIEFFHLICEGDFSHLEHRRKKCLTLH